MLKYSFLSSLFNTLNWAERGKASRNLTERGTNLKKLADAWQPLYQTLNPDQKARLRLLAMHVVREIKEAVRDRRMEMMELEEDEAD